MKKSTLSLAALLITCLFLLFGACTRKDLLKTPAQPGPADVARWLKNKFEGSNAASLLKSQAGKGFSYGSTPEWEKVTVTRDATGRTFYQVPLKYDDYATASGTSRPLTVMGVKTFLIAYAQAGQPENLVFFKGDYLMNEKPSASTLARLSRANVQSGFSGKAIFTNPEGQFAVYQYGMPGSNLRQAPATPSLFTARTIAEDSLYLLDSLVASWGLPDGTIALYDIKSTTLWHPLASLPVPVARPDSIIAANFFDQYPNPFSVWQWDQIQQKLNYVYYNLPDLMGGGEGTPGQWRCEKRCHWAADCSGTPGHPGGIVVTVTTTNADFCIEPATMATCSNGFSPWYLVQTENGACSWTPGGGGGGGGTIPLPPLPPLITFDEENLVNVAGNKPLLEFPNKCTGLRDIWNNYTQNEVFGYVTIDNQFIVTDILALTGGSASGAYKYTDANNVTTYYFVYADTQGAPTGTYSGIIHVAGKYFIPIKASVHTHTPCRTDGTNGVSHSVGTDDKAFATSAPGISHWVIGCSAIAQFNTGNQFFNIQAGVIDSTCAHIK